MLTLLSATRGKFKAIAKGVRKPTSRLGGGVEPFAELDLALIAGRTFDTVTQVRSVRVWLGLRGQLGSTAVAWYVAELVERATSDEQPEPELYALLLHAWDLLESGAPNALVARWAELALLDASGQGPELDVCLECGRAPVAGEALRWDEDGGGIRCASHALGGAFSSEALRLMRALRRFPPEELASLSLPPGPLREVSWALRGAVHLLLGVDPKSRSFMDEVLAP